MSSFGQITFFADTTEGCDSLSVVFTYRNTDFVDTVSTVEWDFGNGLTSSGKNDQTAFYDTSGVYSVSILINGNTSITRESYIKVHSSPVRGFQWSDSLELGSFSVAFLAAPQAVDSVRYTYLWEFEDGGTGDTRSVIHRFQAQGNYRVFLRVTHPFGCMSQSSRLVSVRDSLDCPNVFSPNQDGINDYFIVNSNGVTVYSMKIYSKSGVLVFQAESPALIWDGRNLSGQELHPGIYYYVIRPADGSGPFEKTGFINLFR
jgi:gliding motility-associated-like protein